MRNFDVGVQCQACKTMVKSDPCPNCGYRFPSDIFDIPKENGCKRGLCYRNCNKCDLFSVGETAGMMQNGKIAGIGVIERIEGMNNISIRATKAYTNDIHVGTDYGRFVYNIMKLSTLKGCFSCVAVCKAEKICAFYVPIGE